MNKFNAYNQQPSITIPFQAVFKPKPVLPIHNFSQTLNQQQLQNSEYGANQQRTQKDLRITCLKSARIIRPQSSHRILNPDDYYEKFKSHQVPMKKIIQSRIELATIYNSNGRFMDGFKILDPLQRKLILDGTTFKSYVFEFYRHFSLTLIYLACDSQSDTTLAKAEMYIDYFLRLFLIMDYNQFKNQLKIKRQIKLQTIIFNKLKLMSIRVNIQKEGEFVLMKTTVLLDLALLILIRQGVDSLQRSQQLLEKCIKSINEFNMKIKSQVQYTQNNLLLAYVYEKQNCQEQSVNYYEQALFKARETLPEENLIRILIERLFDQERFSLITKFRIDLSNEDKVHEAILMLLIELMKKKITFDLFGKDFNKYVTKDQQKFQKKNLESYMQQPPTMRLMSGIKNSLQKSRSSANISCVPKTVRSSQIEDVQDSKSDIEEQDNKFLMSNQSLSVHKLNTLSSHSPRSHTQKPKANIEQYANFEMQGKVSYVRNNLAKIIQINEEKKVMLEDDFFKETQGNQESISNEISKSVENFFKQSIMKQLKLQSQQKKTDIDNSKNKVGTVIADQETSGKTFWKRFRVQQKEFEKKIYLNEKIDDFKRFFQAKQKVQNGEMNRKVLATPEDFEALRFQKQQKSNKKERGRDQYGNYGSHQSSPGVSGKNYGDRFDQGTITSNHIPGSTLGRKHDQAPAKIPSRKGSIQNFQQHNNSNHFNNEDFDAAMQKFRKQTKKVNVQEQTKKFLDTFKNYDAIGKIIQFNKHKEVFREAFEGNIKE
eukprot:403346377